MKLNRHSNFSDPVAVIILAAGMGKRMRSDSPKVLAPFFNRPLIFNTIDTVMGLNPEKIVIVIGHKGEEVKREVLKEYSNPKIIFAFQQKQLGTGDATQVGLNEIKDFDGGVLILPGDAPLLTEKSLCELISLHNDRKATISLASFTTNNPTGYGRIIKEKDQISAIVEEKDASSEQKLIQEVNSGVYIVDSAFLEMALKDLDTSNSQGEIYLTDIIARGVKEGQVVEVYHSNDSVQFNGVNDRLQLSNLQENAMNRIISDLIEQGVTFTDPKSVYIEPTVVVAASCEIGPNTQLLGKTTIGSGTKIEGTAYIKDSVIGNGCNIKFGVRIEGATIDKECSVGPFAHLRPETKLDDKVKIGNFVEVKKSHLKTGAKASHLTYLGDTEVGEEANIGAGTITCNYDGQKKHKTKIGPGAFIGSNTSLVAPVTVGKDATIGAGSVITKDVSDNALALERTEQREISKWKRGPK